MSSVSDILQTKHVFSSTSAIWESENFWLFCIHSKKKKKTKSENYIYKQFGVKISSVESHRRPLGLPYVDKQADIFVRATWTVTFRSKDVNSRNFRKIIESNSTTELSHKRDLQSEPKSEHEDETQCTEFM